MPKAAAQSYKTRRELQPQETFRYTTPNRKVVARPVDIFVQPSRKTSVLLTALQGMDAVLDSYLKYKEVQNQEDKEKAETLALAGKPLPEDPSRVMIDTYEEITGQGKVYDFYQKATEYFVQNKNADPETFRSGLNQLIQEYTEGKSTAFLKGFVPKAKDIETSLINQYIRAQQEEIKANLLTNVQASIRHELEVNQTNDPVALRKILSDFQKKAKTFNVTRSEVTDAFVRTIYAEAYQKGKPELLKALTIPDENGITVADAIGPNKVVKLIKEVENAKKAQEAARQAANEKYLKKLSDQTTKAVLTKLYSLDETDVDGLLALKQEVLGSQDKLTASAYGALLRAVDGKMGVGGFPKSSDPLLLRALELRVARGQLDYDTLTAFVDKLAQDDFIRLVSKIQSHKESLDNEEYRTWWNTREEFENSVISRVAPQDMLGRFLETNGAEKKARALFWFNKLLEEEQKKQNTKILDLQTLSTIADTAVKRTQEEFGTIGRSSSVRKPIPKPVQPEEPTVEITEPDRLENRLKKLKTRKEG